MEVKEWLMIISMVFVLIGWLVNSHINRNHEIFKKRLDYRLKMFDSYVLAAAALEKLRQSKPGAKNMKDLEQVFIDKLESAQIQILLYGSSAEVEAIKQITEYAKQNNHLELLNKSAEFMNVIRSNLREELSINSI